MILFLLLKRLHSLLKILSNFTVETGIIETKGVDRVENQSLPSLEADEEDEPGENTVQEVEDHDTEGRINMEELAESDLQLQVMETIFI